ncbi:MAG: hypothetical protein C0392_08615 [Syntrophus sp. (in: bacteria)]|nr:hypothetical protein [Syntrophus sp. (in: bacteria)]
MAEDNIIELNRRQQDQLVQLEEVLTRMYNDKKLNNILHELIMAADKILQSYGYQYKGEGDRDFVKDNTHKAFLQLTSQTVKIKEKLGKG